MPDKPKSSRLAIIGGGPKAVAIAAKAAVINEFEFNEKKPAKIEVDIFDPNPIGAHWSGKHGYTDGLQPLCTLAERDLGFPYTSKLEKRLKDMTMSPEERAASAKRALALAISAGKRKTSIQHDRNSSIVDQMLFKRFSWSTYKSSGIYALRDWIDEGRRPPTHLEFSKYLQWAYELTEAHHEMATVVGLVRVGRKWDLKAKKGSERARTFRGYDGVVITGSGPPRRIVSSADCAPQLFNGKDFWERLDEVRTLLREKSASVIVLGGGGTGAAVLAWIAREGHWNKPIQLVGNQATVYARTESSFENKLFSNDESWKDITRENQRIFFDRLNRGVVWSNVVHEIENLKQLSIVDGRATKIYRAGKDLEVKISDAVSFESLSATVVIDATGFDAWWFTELISKPSNGALSRRQQDRLRDGMLSDLTLPLRGPWKYSGVHVPGLSDKHGPGLGTLMTLGAMSDRVLSRYITPSTSPRFQ